MSAVNKWKDCTIVTCNQHKARHSSVRDAMVNQQMLINSAANEAVGAIKDVVQTSLTEQGSQVKSIFSSIT